MYLSGEDERIRARYRDLRAIEETRVPSLDMVLARNERRVPRLTWILVPIAGAALAVALMLLMPAASPPPKPMAQQEKPATITSTPQENANVDVTPVTPGPDERVQEQGAKTRRRSRTVKRTAPAQQPDDQCAEC